MTWMSKIAVDCGCQMPLVLMFAIRALHGGSVLASRIIGSLVACCQSRVSGEVMNEVPYFIVIN